MPTIYPLLKPHDWPHQNRVAHRRLSEGAPELPVIAFGFDAGENYQFVPAKDAPDLEALHREALNNLAGLEYHWEVSESRGLPLATSSGNEFSAERLLDKGAMVECQRLLKAGRIIVAVPRRTCLFATRAGLPDELFQLFCRLVLHTWRDDSFGHAEISPLMFVVQDGSLKSVMVPNGGTRTSAAASAIEEALVEAMGDKAQKQALGSEYPRRPRAEKF